LCHPTIFIAGFRPVKGVSVSPHIFQFGYCMLEEEKDAKKSAVTARGIIMHPN